MRTFILLITGAILLVSPARGQQAEVRRRSFDFAVREGRALRLDLYDTAPQEQSDVKAARPCMIFVFGGGFVSGRRDAERYIPYFEHYARRGYAVASIDYRLGLQRLAGSNDTDIASFVMALAGSVSMAVEDLFAATAYILSRAEELEIDPEKIVASGSSAGAITVLHGEYEICNATPLAQTLLPEGFNYAGIISFAGALLSIGEPSWQQPPVPVMLFHGDADSNVPYESLTVAGAGLFGSKFIARQLAAMNRPYYFYSAENADHIMATRPMTDNTAEVDIFLDRLVFGGERAAIEESVRDEIFPARGKEFTIEDYFRANFMQ